MFVSTVRRRLLSGFLLAALSVIVMVLAACGDDPEPTATSVPAGAATPTPGLTLPGSLKLGTGSVGGSFFVWGGALAQLLERELGIPVSAEVTAGTDENLRLLDSEQVDLTGVTMNRTYAAFRGDDPYEKAFDRMRAVVSLYRSPLLFITRADSGITTVEDLVGKRVGWGTSRGYDQFVGPIFETLGIDWENDIDRIYAGFADLHQQLQDGTLDASVTFVSGGQLAGATKQLMTQRDIVPVLYNAEALERVQEIIPYGVTTVVTEETMAGLSQGDFLALDVGLATIIVNKEMDDALVEAIVKIIYENLDELATIAPQWGNPQQDPSILGADPGIPMHPAASAYWTSVGLGN
jgi:TRAP transporter TAXI family solute receptor